MSMVKIVKTLTMNYRVDNNKIWIQYEDHAISFLVSLEYKHNGISNYLSLFTCPQLALITGAFLKPSTKQILQ